MILGVDPASESIGWAVVAPDGPRVVTSGAITRPASWPAWLRLRSLSDSVARLMVQAAEMSVSRVIVEVPGARQGGWSRSRYATPGVYAVACGVVLGEAWRVFGGCRVVTVESDYWTGEVAPSRSKADRQAAFAAAAGVPRAGRGAHDAIDAAHLAWWWCGRSGRDSDPPLHWPALPMRDGLVYRDSTVKVEDGIVRPVAASRKRR